MESYAFTTKHAHGFLQLYTDKVCFVLVHNGFIKGETRDRPIFLQGFVSADNDPELKQQLEVQEPLDLINYFLRAHSFLIGMPGHVTKIIKYKEPAGKYHHRQRNNIVRKPLSEDECHHLADEIRAYRAIANTLNEVFYVIEPAEANLNAFGHQIRNLFIVACTEVENLLKSFFRDNGRKSENLNMGKYVQSNSWLQLNNYSVSLRLHRYNQMITPFESWPTTHSLNWYQAYNDTKHNRHTDFDKANLKNLIDAVAAIHILICAQWGNDIFDTTEGGQYQSIFKNEKMPEFSVDYILPPIFNTLANGKMGIKYTPLGCFSATCNSDSYPTSEIIFTES
jgi:hypothetical protein